MSIRTRRGYIGRGEKLQDKTMHVKKKETIDNESTNPVNIH